MDVICEHCEAEYEFDETLLSDKGTTVKCSACGHVFRVVPPQRAGGRAPLVLRSAAGSARELASLRALQQLIRDGEAQLDDEIGRDGAPFRKLRDVPELKNFFSGSPLPPKSASSSPSPSRTLLGNSPTARPPEPFRDPAFPPPSLEVPRAPPVPRFAGAEDAAAPAPAARDEKAALRTMTGMGPLSPPRPPLPAYDGPSDTPAANEPPAPRASLRPEAPRAIHADNPTLLGTPAASLPRLEPAAAQAPRSPRPEGPPPGSLPAARGPSPSPLPERAPPASALPRFELPGKAPDSQSPPAVGRAWASAPPPSGPPAPASWAAKSAAPALPSPAPVRLYLPDDDAPPARAMRRTSRVWLVLLLVVLGVGGWIGVHALSTYGGEDVAVAPVATPPAAAPTQAPASPPPDPPTPPPAAAEPPKQPPPAAAAKPADKSADKPASAKPEPAAAKPADKPASAKPAASEPARPKPEDYGQLLGKAAQLAGKGDQAGAIKAYQAALALRPSGSEANSGLGFALLKTNKPNDALPLLDRAAESGFVEANIGLGDAYRKLGQPSSAVEAYRAYLERQPEGPRAAYARTWLDKLEKGADRPRESERPVRDAPPAPAGDDGYRPAGELLPPSEPSPAPAEDTPPPPAPAPAEPAPESAGESNP